MVLLFVLSACAPQGATRVHIDPSPGAPGISWEYWWHSDRLEPKTSTNTDVSAGPPYQGIQAPDTSTLKVGIVESSE